MLAFDGFVESLINEGAEFMMRHKAFKVGRESMY
jgi:hypothetical protein